MKKWSYKIGIMLLFLLVSLVIMAWIILRDCKFGQSPQGEQRAEIVNSPNYCFYCAQV